MSTIIFCLKFYQISSFIVDNKLNSTCQDLLLECLNSNPIEKAATLNHKYWTMPVQNYKRNYLSDAIWYPGAMMVKLLHTTITCRAMFWTNRSHYLQWSQEIVFMRLSIKERDNWIAQLSSTYFAGNTKLWPVARKKCRIFQLHLQQRFLKEQMLMIQTSKFGITFWLLKSGNASSWKNQSSIRR